MFFYGQAKCCGAKNGKDWASSEWFKRFDKVISAGKVPSSCCSDKRDNCFIGGPKTYNEVISYYQLKFKMYSLP